jgi:hypothetical protein
LIHGQHFTAAAAAFFAFPETPAVFVCHGLLPWPETPLIRFRQIKKYIAVDLASRDRLLADLQMGPEDIEIIANGIDLARFQTNAKLAPDRQNRALVFSNQAQNSSIAPLRAACEQAGYQLDVRGAGVGDPVVAPEEILGKYELVFAKARAAMEAMACGCNVILADYGKWGGAVTPDNFKQLDLLNFGLRAMTRELDEEAIAEEIKGLNRAHGAALSALVTETHGLQTMVDKLMALYEEVLAQAPVSQTNSDEAAAFLRKLSPLFYERDELATRLYEETKLRLANEAISAGLLVQAMVSLRDGPDRILLRRMAEQVLFLQPGHPIALEILAQIETS